VMGESDAFHVVLARYFDTQRKTNELSGPRAAMRGS